MSTLSDRVRARLADLAAQRDAISAELSEIAADPEARGLDDTQALARIAELRANGEKLLADLKAAEAQLADVADAEARAAAAAAVRPAVMVGGAHVRSEERTYHAGNSRDRSFVADAWNARNGYDANAKERIERHMAEVRVEKRDITSTTLNGLVPPLYLLDQAAELARASRPLANVIPSFPLPANGMTAYVTRVTTGTSANVQTENGAVSETDMVTTDFAVPIVTITGQQDISRQAVERGQVTDSLVFRDLVEAYNARLDLQIISGSGANGQHKGFLTVSGTGAQTYTATAITTLISKIVGAMNDVASNRFVPATLVVMSPRRWHQLLAASDTSGRPFVLPAQMAPDNPIAIGGTGVTGIVGTLAGGIPVLVDGNMPTNLGAATNEDRIIVTRLQDNVLWEEGAPRLFTFDQAVNSPATIRLAVFGYSAFTAERYPSATSIVVGSGLVAPTF
jgi:HK97 family phage major capsid protein